MNSNGLSLRNSRQAFALDRDAVLRGRRELCFRTAARSRAGSGKRRVCFDRGHDRHVGRSVGSDASAGTTSLMNSDADRRVPRHRAVRMHAGASRPGTGSAPLCGFVGVARVAAAALADDKEGPPRAAQGGEEGAADRAGSGRDGVDRQRLQLNCEKQANACGNCRNRAPRAASANDPAHEFS